MGIIFGIIGAVIGAIFGEGGILIGFLIGVYVGFTHKSKPRYKSSSSGSSSYSVAQDPSMTRWEQRYCSSCGKSTRHKVYRHEQGSSKADYQCKVCGDGYAGSW